MKIIALGSGTSQGIPLIGCKCKTCLSLDQRDKRLRSSVFIKTDDKQILIDIGPDFRQQFLQNQLETIDFVLFTHEHNDHIIGIDDIRAINFTQKKSIPFYAENRVLEAIKSRFHYAFSEKKYPGVPQIDLNEISNEPFQIKGFQIIPIRVMHGRLPILGFKIGQMAYITDASHIATDEINKLKNVDVLIINALRKEKHYSHFNLTECLETIQKIKPGRTYITHISHNMGPTRDWISQLPKNVFPLEDNMTISV